MMSDEIGENIDVLSSTNSPEVVREDGGDVRLQDPQISLHADTEVKSPGFEVCDGAQVVKVAARADLADDEIIEESLGRVLEKLDISILLF